MIALGVTACNSEVWVKPGATRADFEIAKGRCLSSAYSQVPPAQVPITIGGGYTTPTFTTCSGGYYSDISMTTGGRYTPPSTIYMDANQGVRNGVYKGCMYGDGWSLQSRDSVAALPAQPVKSVSEAAKSQAAEYCNNIFHGNPNVGMMAAFKNSIDTCIAQRSREL